jgi:hypothetical protein
MSLLDNTITITVGEGGDFLTINEAIVSLSRKRPSYIKNGVTVELKLLSGFVMSEQVLVRGVDLGWIDIVAEDLIVPTVRSSLTEFLGGYPLFGVVRGTLPTLKATFEMDNSGTSTDRYGYYCRENSFGRVDKGGVLNAGGVGVLAEYNSTIELRDADFSGAGVDGLSARHSSQIQARLTLGTLLAKNCQRYGVYADNTSRIHARNIDVSGAVDSGVFAENSSIIEGRNIKADDCGNSAFRAERNGIVHSRSETVGATSGKNSANHAVSVFTGGRVILSGKWCK